MKTTSKNILVAGLISPALVLAMVSPAMAVDSTGQAARTAVCAKITALKSTSQATLSTHTATMQTDFATRLAKITSDAATVSQKLTTNRQENATKFDAKVQTLLAQPGLTDAQIQTIGTYSDSMKQAELDRETAVDAARANYRASLTSAVSSHQQILTGAVDNYQAALTQIFDNTKSTCASDNSAMSSLKGNIAIARQTLNNVRNNEDLKLQVKQLADTRNAAIKTANETFSTSVKTITETLKTALTVIN